MIRRLAWPALLGIGLGLVAPVGDPPSIEIVAPPAAPAAQAPRAPTPPGAAQPNCVDREAMDAARGAADVAEANLRSVREAFVADWGLPPEPPSGHLALEQTILLNQRLAALDAELVDVDCRFYPCTIVIASSEEVDARALAEAAGVAVDQIASGSVYVDGRSHPVDAIAVIDEAELDPDEARWARRLRERHQVLATQVYLDDLAQRREP